MKAPQAATIGPLLISSSPPHRTHEQCLALRVVTARVLLRPQGFFYVPIVDWTAISTWSSEQREGLDNNLHMLEQRQHPISGGKVNATECNVELYKHTGI